MQGDWCIRVCHMTHFFLLKMGRVGCVILISFSKGQTAQLSPPSCSKAVKSSLCLTKAVSKAHVLMLRALYQVNGKG